MNIVFMGTPKFSVSILEAIHEEYGVSLVVSQPDKVVGRKKILTPTPVKAKAVELGIETFQPRNIKQEYDRVLEAQPDLIITAAYGQIIPNEIIDYPVLGCVNVHGSLLPKLRGGAPIQRAIERGYKETGITIMYMAQKMDSGDIISQRKIPILDTDTSGTLFEKLSVLGTELLLDTLPSIIDRTNDRIPQDIEEVTFAYNLKREEEKIDFSMNVEELERKMRAFSPSPGLYTIMDGKQLKVFKMSVHPCSDFETHHGSDEFGTVLKIFDDSFGVKCNNGVIRIHEVQLAGKQRQTVDIFMNGAGRNLIKVNKKFS
jgi:methionyl-tRNA formyltransferase